MAVIYTRRGRGQRLATTPFTLDWLGRLGARRRLRRTRSRERVQAAHAAAGHWPYLAFVQRANGLRSD